MAVELRCDMRLHGVLTDEGEVEIACRSRLCGHEPGVLVIHKFDAVTGRFLGTKRYKDAGEVKGAG
jgi:hypothetical protein